MAKQIDDKTPRTDNNLIWIFPNTKFAIKMSTALKRLMTEYKELTVNPPEGIQAGPFEESNYFEWEALIMGPEVIMK
jgi:hypothetical protein